MHEALSKQPVARLTSTARQRRRIASTMACILVPAWLFAQGAAADNHITANPPVTIEASDFLEWNQTEGTYIAKGKAYVVQGQSNISADHIIANYVPSSKSRDLTRVVATGAVLYNNGENSARGDRLDYDLTASSYVLTGQNARASGPQGTMTANKSITFDDSDINRQIVTAIGKARYQNSDGRIIHGDRLVAVLDADGALINIDAFDNTKVVTEQGTTATADQLIYIASTALAKLSGNVVINDRDNVMRGARAEIDFDRDVSRILSDGSGKRVSGLLTP
jgi:lipopolysaccharide export system protein LptA